MAICANCAASIEYGSKYCENCLDYLVSTNKLSYADKWKYKYSGGGCIGCKSINGGDRICEGCIRSHQPIPPFTDNYVRS